MLVDGSVQEGPLAAHHIISLSDLERGRSNPSLAMGVDLARALVTHPSVMLAGLVIEEDAELPRRKRPKD
ncbi:hypothetical protein [Azospirillum brasilense]|uniref:hypothetical protein n=1 Tax=Azospirillum brasilense TaxID=192 RepID=UPI001EDAEA80|nr:hypothetical protein [Azospirillum brasilense]UKJ74426.1 hypothetical protein H1Q64_21625 [Azospirillum brasilense]